MYTSSMTTLMYFAKVFVAVPNPKAADLLVLKAHTQMVQNVCNHFTEESDITPEFLSVE